MQKLAAVIGRIILGALITVCGGLAASTQPSMKVGYVAQTHQANMIVLPRFAQARGLKVELVPMRRFPDLQLALTTKQVDAAVLGYVNVALLEDKNFQDYKVVSGVYVAPGSLVLAPDVEEKVKTWKDLEGKSLGTAPNGAIDLAFRALLKERNVDQSKVKLVSFGALGPPLQTALKSRNIDGFIAWEPNNAEAVAGKYGVYSHLDIGDNPTKGIQGILVVDSTFAANHSLEVGNLVAGLVDSTNYLNSHPEEFAEVAQRATGSTMNMIKLSIPRGRLDIKLYQQESEVLMDIVYDAGLTQKPTKSAIAKHFDYQWLMKATGKSRAELGGR
jgi:sulfonate transport system substrate-binding protein